MFSAELVWLTGRILSAAIGGYLLTMGICLWIAQLSGLDQNDARMFNTLAFFLMYLLVIIVSFAVRSHHKAVGLNWLGNLLIWPLWWLLQGGAST